MTRVNDKELTKALKEWASSEEIRVKIKNTLEKELAKVLKKWEKTGKITVKTTAKKK